MSKQKPERRQTTLRQGSSGELSSVSLTSSSYQGPLPPASEFERYNLVLPTAAERILALAEAEQAHRHQLQRTAHKQQETIESESILLAKQELEILARDADADRREARFGQVLGFAFGISAIAGSLLLSLKGDYITASVLAGAPLAAILSRFIHPRRSVLSKVQHSTEDRGLDRPNHQRGQDPTS